MQTGGPGSVKTLLDTNKMPDGILDQWSDRSLTLDHDKNGLSGIN